MNDMTIGGGKAVTMTSLELVEFINIQRGEGEAELRHRDFTAKVPRVLGEEMSGKFRTSLKDAYSRDQPGYSFPKREACLMAMSYSYELQAKVFDRMTELEARPAQLSPANMSRLQLIELAMQAEQERLQLELKVDALAPKAEALDRIATHADGAMCVTAAAKLLQMQPKALFAWLSQHQWIYRRSGSKEWLAYQDRIQAGCLEHKVRTGDKLDGSGEWIGTQVLVTAKGLAKISEALNLKSAA